MQTQLELQAAFRDAILSAAGAADLSVAAAAGLPSPSRLRVHARNYRTGLTAALEAIFPAVRRFVGDGFFTYAAARFVTSHPPSDPIVARYGAHFSDFLGRFDPVAHLLWLPDLACLEWTLHRLSFKRPHPPLTPLLPAGALDAHCGWSGSAALIASRHPVDALLRSDDPAGIDLTVPVSLLLRSSDDGVVWRRLEMAEFAFLSSLRSGQSLGTAIARALEHDPAFPFPTALARACAEGCVTSLSAIQESAP